MRVSHFNVALATLMRTGWVVTLPRGVADIFNDAGHLPFVLERASLHTIN